MSRITKNDKSEEEIDLKKIFGIIYKGKKIIASITASTFIIGILYLLIKKPTYEGQFQIVLKSSEPNLSMVDKLRGFAGGSGQIPSGLFQDSGLNSDLMTEIGILKSPLLLMSIFEEIKENKINNGENIEKLQFKDWLKENLTVELDRGTTILNLAYRDSDKNLIIPTLNKISDKYQIYSSRDRKRGINQGIDYLSNEIEKYAIISKKSAKELHSFALTNDLPSLSRASDVSGIGIQGNDIGSSAFVVESIRLDAINKIRAIDQKLKQLKDNKKLQKKTFLIGSTIPETSQLPQQLEQINQQLAILRTKYKEEDESIKSLEIQRISLIKLLHKTTKDYLNSKRDDLLADLNAAKRKEDILFSYNELQKKATRDEITLVNLKNELRMLELEKTKYLNPWELITKPTLLNEPVSPIKIRILGLSIILGLISGSLYVLYNNKYSKK